MQLDGLHVRNSRNILPPKQPLLSYFFTPFNA